MSAQTFDKLAQSLSLIFGTEAIIVLKDIWGLDDDEVREVALWAAHALVATAVAEASLEGDRQPPLQEPRRTRRETAQGRGLAAKRQDALPVPIADGNRKGGTEMLRKTWTGLLAGAAIALAAGPAAAQELTIFWAEWDPANYLQELVNEYTAETGVTVTVQTTPWPDFQTKAFAEFNAQGDAYDMVVGDSQWLGAGSTGGHYVDLTDFFAKHKVAELMAPATVEPTTPNIRRAARSTGRSRSRATRPAGPIARTGSKTRRRWKPSRRSTATTSPCRRPTRSCATSPSSSIVRTRSSYGIAHLHRQLL